MFALLTKGQYVESPIPKWGDSRTAAFASDLTTVLRRHSPAIVLPTVRDADYCAVPVAALDACVAHTLRTLQKQGIRYTKNAWDCEDFVNELHQVLRKSAALAGIERAPLSCVVNAMLDHGFAGVHPKPGSAHALACVLTESGPFIIECQNGTRCPIEVYPNKARMYEAWNL
jgi:hypothetical protein